jgi:hypothetical protein
MKKIISALLIVVLLPVVCLSQVNRGYKQFVTNAVCTTDSAFEATFTDNYCWNILIKWSANDGTTSTVKLQQSIDGVTWFDYSGLDTTTITGATGSCSYEDSMLVGNKLRVLLTVQSGKKCTLNCYYNLKRK